MKMARKSSALGGLGSFDQPIKGTLIGGGISGMFWLINWLSDLSNADYFGPNIANIFMEFFYSLIISAVILCLKERL
ncbi:MAG: hypothetical protein ACI4S2_04465 [Lachnospiraceae bacterium]